MGPPAGSRYDAAGAYPQQRYMPDRKAARYGVYRQQRYMSDRTAPRYGVYRQER